MENVVITLKYYGPGGYVRIRAGSAIENDYFGIFLILPLTYLIIQEELLKSLSNLISKMGISIPIYIIEIF